MDAVAKAAPVIAWYGDDFTGSAVAMEALTFAGVESVLFADIPELNCRRFSHCSAFGIASTARSHGPAWMETNL